MTSWKKVKELREKEYDFLVQTQHIDFISQRMGEVHRVHLSPRLSHRLLPFSPPPPSRPETSQAFSAPFSSTPCERATEQSEVGRGGVCIHVMNAVAAAHSAVRLVSPHLSPLHLQ